MARGSVRDPRGDGSYAAPAELVSVERMILHYVPEVLRASVPAMRFADPPRQGVLPLRHADQVYVVGHQTPRLEPNSLSIRVLAHQRQAYQSALHYR